MKKPLVLLVFIFAVNHLFSKCNLPADFYYTLYDTAAVFYLSGGSSNASYYYDFGDGTQSQTGKYPKGLSHKYKNNGVYIVTMFYWDPVAICRDTVSRILCRFVMTDVPLIKRSNDTLIAEINCLPNAKYVWYFSPDLYGFSCKNKIKMPEPTFYSIQLITVRDTPSGCYYSNLPPAQIMNFTKCGFASGFSYMKGQGNVQVYSYPKFNDPSPIQGIEKWYWGDGTFDSYDRIENRSLNHDYGVGGNYNICHVLKDSAKFCVDSFCQILKVDSCVANADFSYTVEGDIISVSGTVSGVSWKWLLEDQLIAFYQTDLKFRSVKNGNNRVCIEVTSNSGCKRTVCKDVYVMTCGVLDQNSIIKWADEDSCEIANFTNTHLRYTSYKWDFGDGAFSNLKSDRHLYKNKGYYFVRLYAYDSNAPHCNKSIGFSYYNDCNSCKLKTDLTLEYNAKVDGATIFNRSRNFLLNKPVHKHKWDFGDGTTSEEATPTHIYNNSGLYEIKYVCRDTIGNCLDSMSLFLVIDNGKSPFYLNVNYTPFGVGLADVPITDELYYYPIPFKTQLTIEGQYFSGISSVVVYNNLGQKVDVTIQASNDQLNLFFDPNLNSGIYYVVINDDQMNKAIKVIKE
ncbi:MAG TPA: PKD domain-containing protein [Bacteroidia bacterium]